MTRNMRLKDVLSLMWIEDGSFLDEPDIHIKRTMPDLNLEEIDKAEVKREISLMLMIDDDHLLRIRWANLNSGIDADGNTIRRMLSAVKNAL